MNSRVWRGQIKNLLHPSACIMFTLNFVQIRRRISLQFEGIYEVYTHLYFAIEFEREYLFNYMISHCYLASLYCYIIVGFTVVYTICEQNQSYLTLLAIAIWHTMTNHMVWHILHSFAIRAIRTVVIRQSKNNAYNATCM